MNTIYTFWWWCRKTTDYLTTLTDIRSNNSPKTMRICLVNPTRRIRRPISELAHELLDREHDVGILTPEGRTGYHHEDYLDNATIHKYQAWDAPGSYEFPIPKNFHATLRSIEDDYNIFHSWTNFYISSLLLAWEQPDSHVVTLDTIPGESFTMNWCLNAAFWLYNRTIGRWTLTRATKTTVYSDELTPYLRQTGFQDDVSVTPTGVIEPTVEETPDLPDDYVAFIGLITERKGIDRVLTVAQSMPDTAFLVAGDSPERHEWMERAPPNVEFLGQITYVPALLDQARCLLLPSRGEGLPGVVMEAMAMRCPVVASNIPCIPDLIPDDDHGFLIDEDNIDGYTDAINTCKDKQTVQELTVNAYKRVRDRFSWATATQRFIDVYNDTLES